MVQPCQAHPTPDASGDTWNTKYKVTSLAYQ